MDKKTEPNPEFKREDFLADLKKATRRQEPLEDVEDKKEAERPKRSKHPSK